MNKNFELMTQDESDFLDEILCNVPEEDRGEVFDGYDS